MILSRQFDPGALRDWEQHALGLVEAGRYAQALTVLELCLNQPGAALGLMPLYVLCLARVGEVEKALEVGGRTSAAIHSLPPSADKDALTVLINTALVAS